MNRFFNKLALLFIFILIFPVIVFKLITDKAASFSKEPLEFLKGMNAKLDIAIAALKQPTE